MYLLGKEYIYSDLIIWIPLYYISTPKYVLFPILKEIT